MGYILRWLKESVVRDIYEHRSFKISSTTVYLSKEIAGYKIGRRMTLSNQGHLLKNKLQCGKCLERRMETGRYRIMNVMQK